MPESIPKRGDLVFHEPTKEQGFVSGWVEDMLLIYIPAERKQIPLHYQEGDFTILIGRADIQNIDGFLPKKVDLLDEQPKDDEKKT